MTDRGESLPPAGHPGPRWQGDGSLGGRQPSPAEVALQELRERHAVATDRDYASFWRRLGSWLVDEACKTLLWLAIVTVFTILMGDTPQTSDDLDPLALLPRAVLSLGYDWMFWTEGWTPGARLVGIRIVRADGAPPGPARAAGRVAGSMISGIPFFIGYLWMLRSPRRQTWHDALAGTYVVNVPSEDGRAS